MFGRWKRQEKVNARIWEHLDAIGNRNGDQLKLLDALRKDHDALASLCASENSSVANQLRRMTELGDQVKGMSGRVASLETLVRKHNVYIASHIEHKAELEDATQLLARVQQLHAKAAGDVLEVNSDLAARVVKDDASFCEAAKSFLYDVKHDISHQEEY